MAYQAWVTNAQTVLRRRREEQARRDGPGRPPTGACARVRGRGWGAPGQGLTSTPVRRRRPGPGPGGGAGGRPRRDHGSWYVHPGAGGLRGGEAGAGGVSASHPAGRGPVMRRVLSTVQFLWVLAGALVDGLTDWLLTFTRHHRAMSDVLRAERYLYTQELLRVRACGPSTPGAPPPPLGPRLHPGAPPPETTALSISLTPIGQTGAPQLGGPTIPQRGRGHTARILGGPRCTKYGIKVGAGWRGPGRGQLGPPHLARAGVLGVTQTGRCVVCWPLVHQGPRVPLGPRGRAEGRWPR